MSTRAALMLMRASGIFDLDQYGIEPNEKYGAVWKTKHGLARQKFVRCGASGERACDPAPAPRNKIPKQKQIKNRRRNRNFFEGGGGPQISSFFQLAATA